MTAEYGLVMPFVTCKTNGGIHDDDSYVAGYEMGKLDASLQVAAGIALSVKRTIHAVNRPQADLLAMKTGWLARFEEIDGHPEWVRAEFTPAGTTDA